MNSTYCCKDMENFSNLQCSKHKNVFDCTDVLIYYSEIYNEYGIIIHDGGDSSITIAFCPWCGKELPKSERDRWFSELELLGFEDPIGQEIPEKFKSSMWRK